MILADTSIWVDHFRLGNENLRQRLIDRQITMHPFIVAELALGSLPARAQTLTLLEQLPTLRIAQLSEVRQMIESHALYGRGIGLIDAHLIAAILLNPSTRLWTKDKHLQSTAKAIGIQTV